jgi:hypothetical protein
MLVLLALPWLVLGCAENSAERRQAARCAESWKARGFDFDPDAMTCTQMFERAQATWKAEYWRKQGYVFDPATMTAQEMDRKARELQQAGQAPSPAAAPPAAQARGGANGKPQTAQTPSTTKAAGTEVATPQAAQTQGNAQAGGNGAATAKTPQAQAGPAVANGGSAPAGAAAADPKAEANLKKMLKGMTIADVRTLYPQYNDLDDVELARRIHAKYFGDTPFDEFARRFFGYSK